MQKLILDAITVIMEKRGVTQDQLAASLGCSQTTISRLLRGKTKLTVEDLFNIAKALNTDPTVLVEQASRSVPQPVTLSPEIQAQLTNDGAGFQIFNRLKVPMTFSELATYFRPDQIPLVRRKITDLKRADVIIEDIDGRLRLNHMEEAERFLFTQDQAYNDRIVELYGMTRSTKGDLSKMNERDAANWRRYNGDAIFVDYFSPSQIEEQKTLLLQFYNFIRYQLRTNRLAQAMDPTGKRDVRETKELRVIYLSSLPYPDSKSTKPGNGG
jgi:transcriptional regulator with XRE-family HTH domain